MNGHDWRGLRVGLFGGSFNPPHAGHVHNSEVAIKYLGLDAVWWLVSPGNPLKSKAGLPDVTIRMELCRKLVTNPKIVICDLESRMGTTRTYDTVCKLQGHFPHTRFVWLAGTEIAYEFQRWYKWQELIKRLPFGFVGRPSKYGVVRNNCFRRDKSLSHHVLLHGKRPPLERGHIYWMFSEKLHPLSSTFLREQQDIKYNKPDC